MGNIIQMKNALEMCAHRNLPNLKKVQYEYTPVGMKVCFPRSTHDAGPGEFATFESELQKLPLEYPEVVTTVSAYMTDLGKVVVNISCIDHPTKLMSRRSG
jgi:hypothetical protein